MKRLLLCAVLLLSATVQANPYETRLANGLRIIVKEDHRAPTAVQMVWYRAGSMDEQEGTSGVAHVLEHMMFKGTKKIAPGAFSRRVAAMGGRENAFTSLDYTAYFQQVPKGRLADVMALEADRMANLKLDAKEFASEIKVVMEERRMRTEDEPIAKVHEAMRAVAFQAHPYHRPVIGWMDDLEHMSWLDARGWYRDWYNPANAYVVIVGDVDHEEVFRLAARNFGAIRAQAQPGRKPRNEPRQEGLRRVTVKAPAKLPYVALAWKVPKLKDVEKDREPYALEVLATLLDGHDAARFPRRLVREEKIAQSAGASYGGTLRGEALFTLDAQPAEGRTVAELETALRAEITRIVREGVSAEELARVKVQTIAGQVYKRDSMMGQAMEIGHVEASGYHWRDIDRMLEKIRSVSAEEVQAVAAKYFGDDTLTVATLDPLPLAQEKPPAAPAPHRH
ncbi:M16 family metallopeptidase [Denitratisoma oestradiolicum]|uniref:Putative peptidase M16 n=1 Tax=Denitratisoma oestradiolicum TaxID=311182 RepID=A0A6S6Y5L0_9PROT|nr:pitrilysin family protein [Denitratisoma oestradiolicum]TWO81829.1 peptidase M16 [Denitratisoma oestradiolicum]CAB1370797.1 putative peptidase M16 [Denitratisoma oestradiolicum]